MSNVVPFPIGRRLPEKAIPREEFEQLAELALDVVQRIITLLDDEEDADGEIGCDARSSSTALGGPISELPWRRRRDGNAGLDDRP